MKKNNIPALTTISLLLALAFACTHKLPREGINTTTELKNLIADPPSEYRSAPLWDWNEKITEEGIDFQMKEFKKAGIGGVFVHPRPGLLTEYLSDDWFHLFGYALQKGKELDMKVWIYDENSYPSGFAGGHVPADMPDSYKHGSGLSMEVMETLNVQLSDTIAVILKKNGSEFVDISANVSQESGKNGTYYIFRKTYPSKSPWYGGFTYVDLLYPGVTQKFIDLTMTRGYERNKADFGKTLQGSFTDEPNLEAAMSEGSMLRWTPDLWEAFQNRWGYDLRVNLPALLEETGNWKKVRHDYFELLLELFIDRWAKPWSKYCSDNNLKWTGHYWEHGWPVPTDGLDESAFYLWHQQPGIDMLGNRLDTAGLGGQFGNDRAVRELRSAANQSGWKRTLSETYGGGGWEMNFETQKRLVDWEVALGVNFVNQHLSYYSLNGVRKFDYPPSFSYHEPWWENYKLMGDYIGRICLAMSSGEQINHILVLQPNTTAWMYFSRKVENPALNTIRDGFKNFIYQMEQQHLEYDLGSENVLKTIGSVSGKTLKAGKRNYSLVVIPAGMENIDKSTFLLLKKYVANGGKVLSFRDDIPLLDGELSSEVNDLIGRAGGRWVRAQKLTDASALELLRTDDFSLDVKGKNGMLYHQRRVLDDGQLLFVVNSHPTLKTSATISLKGKSVSKIDLVSGKVYHYPAKSVDGKVSLDISFDPAGSALFIVNNTNSDEPQFIDVTGEEKTVQATGALTVTRESDNVLMVNYLDLKTAKTDKKDVYFMDALIGLYNENGLESGNPWQHKIQYKKSWLDLDNQFKPDSWFEADYHFNINPGLKPEAMKSIRAVVERPELWKVLINGHEVSPLANSWWIDKNFPQYPVGDYLKSGVNTLTIKASRMNILAEVTPVYLLGDFIVKPGPGTWEINGGDINTPGSWRDLGLPFYSQKVAYTQNFKVSKAEGGTFIAKLNRWKGSVAEVLVNGKAAGLIAWQPYQLDVTRFLNEGDNDITVKVAGSLKNAFGFFYQNNDNWIFGPWSWNYSPEKPPSASQYFLNDCGLMEPFSLLELK